ncbi:isochorismate synthase [Microcoleus sp. FACHB-53]|nr:isochorismate synthase [Microcoleus sp. FACHB-53]
MPVTPYRTNLFQDRKELHQLLLTGKQQSLVKGCPQIVSISQEIEPLDPLAVLQAIAKPEQLQVYFEKASKREAIAAIDATLCLKTEGANRFTKAQQFIQATLDNTLPGGNLNLPFSGPHFFCSFTFFDKKQAVHSPFPAATIFLPRWQISCVQGSCVVVANVEINPQTNLQLLIERLCNQLRRISWYERRVSNIFEISPHKIIKQAPKNAERFKSSVLSALESIRANQLRKIVLASAIDVLSPEPFNLVDSLDTLRKRHPDCYIFSSSNGNGQNFIGASPERLISIRHHQLEVDSLAGSAPRGRTITEDEALAYQLISSEKERREHQFVINFIVEQLSELGLIPQMLPTPQLLKLSNIQHLWTPIQAQMLGDIHPLEIVAQLHPTPAVAGVPTKMAQEQIRRYETFDRTLYAAPLGWVDYQGNCEFIVGIRSALIESEKPARLFANAYRARLYAGAGIVAGSDPNKEFAEIQLKLQALLKALL